MSGLRTLTRTGPGGPRTARDRGEGSTSHRRRWSTAGIGVVSVLLIALIAIVALDRGPVETAAPGLPPVLADAADDCVGCLPGEEITGLAIVPTDGGTEIHVELADGAAGDLALWLWLADHTPHPASFEATAGGWDVSVPGVLPFAVEDLTIERLGGRVVLRVEGRDLSGPLAVVSSGGDRVPETGYAVSTGGRTTGLTTEGAVATRIEGAVAAVQRGFPTLDDAQRALARVVLARQLTPGTYRYDLSFADRPELRLEAQVSIRFPEVVQTISAEIDGQMRPAQSIHVLADAVTVCVSMVDGSVTCERDDDLSLPITGLAGMVADPASVAVQRGPARSVLGEAATCWLVVTSNDTGPPEGESCSLTDGVLAVNDNHRTGHRLVLTEQRSSVDDAVFTPPEE